jgi:hypothetical protein
LTLDAPYRALLTHYAFGKPGTSVQLQTGDLAKILAGDFADDE